MRGKSKGNQFCFKLAGNSSYQGFKLSGFNCSPFVSVKPVYGFASVFSFLRFLPLSVKNFDF